VLNIIGCSEFVLLQIRLFVSGNHEKLASHSLVCCFKWCNPTKPDHAFCGDPNWKFPLSGR